MEKLIILCDYGLDDAVATIYLLNHSNLFSSIDIVAIAGNTDAQTSLINAKKILTAYEGDVSKVRLVDTTMIKQNFNVLAKVHGDDGIGGILTEVKDDIVPVLSYNDWIKDPPRNQNAIMGSFGPCTVTKMIFDAWGEFPVLVMGGNVSEKPNYHEYEFNHYLDIPAFNAVVKSYDCVVATLDTCRDKFFNLVHNPSKSDDLLGRFINRSRQLALARHPDRCFIYDFIATHYLVDRLMFYINVKIDKENNILRVLTLKTKYKAPEKKLNFLTLEPSNFYIENDND